MHSQNFKRFPNLFLFYPQPNYDIQQGNRKFAAIARNFYKNTQPGFRGGQGGRHPGGSRHAGGGQYEDGHFGGAQYGCGGQYDGGNPFNGGGGGNPYPRARGGGNQFGGGFCGGHNNQEF